jgi:hypothetical protein
VPAPADGGTSYTFRLRAGIRYDFRHEIERSFRLGSPGSEYFASIVGAAGRLQPGTLRSHVRNRAVRRWQSAPAAASRWQ